jgi:type I restriction enzyme S subunit
VYRQSLLKWAFEGKLTNKSVKEGELPKGWKSLKLKDITLEKEGLRRGPFGSALKKEFFVPNGYKVYEQGNAIKNDPYRGTYFINESKYQELINFKVIPFDLIVSCSGVTLGRICEIPSDAKPGIINQALLKIRLKHNLILNKYFVLHFRGAFFQKKIFDQSQGTALPNLVGIKDFKEIEMLVPPIEQQRFIVDELESKLTVCDNIEETISHSLQQAETLRQSILKKAFEGKLVTQNPNDEPASKLLGRIKAESAKSEVKKKNPEGM